MRINCDKCGYILGGIEVKENYGCNACNPFYVKVEGSNPVCPDCLPYDKCMKHADKLNPPLTVSQNTPTGITGNTHSAVNSVPVFDTMPKAPTRPPLPIKYCGICARILTQTSIGTYYNHDTAEQYNYWRFTCPEYHWWKVWDRYHTNFRCNEDGSTYAYEI